MLRLNVLGGLALLRDGRPVTGRPAQRLRLALLTLVGMEGHTGHGISRDRVAAYLWPEGDDERSRHALAQLLYVVRRDLGGDDLIAGQDILRLDAERLTIDAIEFAEALACG